MGQLGAAALTAEIAVVLTAGDEKLLDQYRRAVHPVEQAEGLGPVGRLVGKVGDLPVTGGREIHIPHPVFPADPEAGRTADRLDNRLGEGDALGVSLPAGREGVAFKPGGGVVDVGIAVDGDQQLRFHLVNRLRPVVDRSVIVVIFGQNRRKPLVRLQQVVERLGRPGGDLALGAVPLRPEVGAAVAGVDGDDDAGVRFRFGAGGGNRAGLRAVRAGQQRGGNPDPDAQRRHPRRPDAEQLEPAGEPPSFPFPVDLPLRHPDHSYEKFPYNN